MGLPMANINEPTVQSGPTSRGVVSSAVPEDASLQDLIAEKERLESEMSALGAILESNGVNMRTSLTTFDGFPRADIDVALIRTTRARIIHLRNDHKALMNRIEKGLHEYFASQPADRNRGTSSTQVNGDSSIHTTSEPAFAKVNGVNPGSPASAAGLQVGDRIYKFGDANWVNHEGLTKVAQIVQRNEGRTVVVQVLRDVAGQETSFTLTLIPMRDWGGRGLLGCHLLPL